MLSLLELRDVVNAVDDLRSKFKKKNEIKPGCQSSLERLLAEISTKLISFQFRS